MSIIQAMTQTLGERLRELREDLGMRREDVATALSVTTGTITNWELGRSDPNWEAIGKLADVYKTTTDYIIGRKRPPGVYRTSRTAPVRIMGRIAAGQPMLAIEEDSEALDIPTELLPPGEQFLVEVVGDSMKQAKIYDGDLALIQVQDSVEDNEIAAVLILADNEVTIKRVHWFKQWVALEPENDEFIPTNYRANEIRILGKFIFALHR